MFPRSTAAPDISDSGRSPHFSGNHGTVALQTPAHVCQYSANLRLPAPGLEPARFQSAYGAATDRSAPSVGVPLRAGGSFVVFDCGFPKQGRQASSPIRRRAAYRVVNLTSPLSRLLIPDG